MVILDLLANIPAWHDSLTMRCLTIAILGFMIPVVPVRAAEVDYIRDIKPILRTRCYACHSAVRQKASLRLDAAPLIRKGNKRGPVVVPGKPDESRLLDAVLGKDRPRMPPEKDAAALCKSEIALLREWIEQGARAPDEPIPADPRDHWAFQPPIRPVIPKSVDTKITSNPIDSFISAERAKQKLTPNPAAEKAVLLRRVYLDLVGVPPTRDELRAFADDKAPDAYEKVVDQLLTSPRYGERWGRHWMDVWRYSDPFGFGEEFRYSQRHIWRWRDWIIDSLNQDKGYDRMIVEMLAGDELAPGDNDTLRATGFLARNWYKFNRNFWMQDTVEYTAVGFLGITLRCARCHDHKYDPISQEDYYHFRAFFEPHDVRIDALPHQPDLNRDGVARVFDARPDAPTYLFQRGDERQPDKSRPLSPGLPEVLGGEVTVRPVTFGLADHARALGFVVEEVRRLAQADVTAAEAGKGTIAAEKKLAAARALLTAVEARIAAEKVRYTEPVDQARWKVLALAAAKAERQAAVLKAIENISMAEQAVEKAKADAASKKKAATAKAVTEADKKLAAARKAHEAALAVAAKEDVNYTPLVKLNPASSTGRRLALARWIADRGNPLTARVVVNHMWMRHFGKPLVDSVANFGLNGKKPSHPQLLDWLAVEFMESGWSMKHLHRLIVTSDTYRLSSRNADSANRKADPENRYYWRMNPRRMEAEAIRDSVLAVAGQLDPTMGGPIINEKQGQTTLRRSIYFRFNTEYKMQFLDQFDLASPTECYQRAESIIPQQALSLNNSALTLNQSRLLARKLAISEPAEFVTAAFEQVLNRRPSDVERDRCEQFLKQQTELFKAPGKLEPFPANFDSVIPPATDPRLRAREDLIHVLFNHNDFVTIR